MPRRRFGPLAILLALVALLAIPIAAQAQGTGALTVVAYNSLTGGPVAGAQVTLSPGETGTTNAQGTAIFNGIPAQDYSLNIATATASSGTAFTTVQENLRTVIAVAVIPNGAYPQVRPVVFSTMTTAIQAPTLTVPQVETRVYLQNTTTSQATGVNLAVGASFQTSILDCWAGAPGTNPCERKGNNDAQWLVPSINPGTTTGPFSTTYRATQLPSSLTDGQFEVVQVSWAVAGTSGTYTVSLGETPLPVGGSWLNQNPPVPFNTAGASIPLAPSGQIAPNCASQTRTPANAAEQAVAQRGWLIFGQTVSNQGVQIVNGLSGTDGMCRPWGFNAFVFVNGTYAGTLSPVVMNSREDGVIQQPVIGSATQVTAPFSRYTPSDPLCCPSSTSTVVYAVTTPGGTPVINPVTVNTIANQ